MLEQFDAERPIVGMVHLPPLPGAPGFDDRAAVVDRARSDAEALLDGGVDGLLVENYGDAPYYPESVPKHVVASMTAVTRAVVEMADVPVGVNVLRNDAEAAVSVAGAADGSFIRVNVHTGGRLTDQGVLSGRAHETIRLRDRIAPSVDVLADVAVKHSSAIADRSLETMVSDTVERGLADGIVVSGSTTGETAPTDIVETVAKHAGGTPVFVGSGVTPANVGSLLDIADGVIVGTALKRDDETDAPVDRAAVKRLLDASR
ncbi:MAG: BtpA/SgcQ family protein [Natronomonas sp.]